MLDAVLPQASILIRIVLQGFSGGQTGMRLTGDMSPGSFMTVRTFSGSEGCSNQFIILSAVPHPASASNLIREEDDGDQCDIVSLGGNGLFD